MDEKPEQKDTKAILIVVGLVIGVVLLIVFGLVGSATLLYMQKVEKMNQSK